MKKFVCLIFTFTALIRCDAQTRPEPHAWKAVLNVVDDAGQAVPGAAVWVSYSLPASENQKKDWGEIRGLTDKDGRFSASHKDQSVSLGFHAQKLSYYPTAIQHFLGFSAEDTKVNWNPIVTLTLIKIGKPIAMYAKRQEAKIPKEDPLGFDLAVGDWVAPFGAGRNTDIIFTAHRKIAIDNDYDGELKLAFPRLGDGIVPIPPDGGNRAPVLLRTAPELGYQTDRVWHHTPTLNPEPVQGYFFRVRTVLDEKGNVVSALYGKIKEDIKFYVGTRAPNPGLAFTYYLNPTPNSRNLEFDPKANLFRNLGPGESPAEP